MLLGAACSRHTVIPDEELAMIFRDAYLANAYISDQRVSTDSLRIYEPIFARYGYTTEDVHYTIGNFSKRKSARLSDVVERAIDLLEAEGKIYNRQVEILDTIDNVARRTCTRTVLADSMLHIRSLRDTSLLRRTIDVQPGEYRVTMRYSVDSLDRNRRGLKAMTWLERANGTRSSSYTSTLRRDRDETFTRLLTADSTHQRLHLDLLDFYDRPERPSMFVEELRVEYTPPTEKAVEELYDRQLDIRIFADDFFRTTQPADSL